VTDAELSVVALTLRAENAPSLASHLVTGGACQMSILHLFPPRLCGGESTFVTGDACQSLDPEVVRSTTAAVSKVAS